MAAEKDEPIHLVRMARDMEIDLAGHPLGGEKSGVNVPAPRTPLISEGTFKVTPQIPNEDSGHGNVGQHDADED